jgi:hypothetical protein
MILHTATILGTLLATLTTTLAKPVSAVPLLGQRDTNNACTIDAPFPTEQSYRQAVSQFCKDVLFERGETRIFTYELKDSRNNSIYWILSMFWTPGWHLSDRFNVDRDTCLEKFNAFIDDSSCMQGETRAVMGGVHDIRTELPNPEPDSAWVVETRQRNGKPPCELSGESCT